MKQNLRLGQWSLVLAMLAIMFVTAAHAESASPQAFVEAIYKPYLNKSYKGAPYSKTSYIRRTFEAKLADAMIKDFAAAAKRKEVSTLDGDPFLDAQDWEVSGLKVEVKTAGADKAVATVNFINIREPKTVTIDLVKLAGGWRIADINAPSGSLRKLYKLS